MGLTSSALHNTIGNLTTLFSQWLIIMIIPTITDFTEAGIFAIAISIASIINQISICSLNQYQIADGYSDYSKNDYSSSRTVTIITSYIITILICILFNYDIYQILIILAYAIYRNVINYSYIHVANLQISNRFDYTSKCMMVEGIISFSVFSLSYVVTNSLLIAIILMAIFGGGIFYITTTCGDITLCPSDYRFKFTWNSNVKKLLIIGISLLISTISPTIINVLPRLLLDHYFNSEIVGYFSTLAAPTMIIPAIATSMFVPWIADFKTICNNKDLRLLRHQYTATVGYLVLFGCVCVVFSYFFSNTIFVSIYGNTISSFTNYFSILIVGIVFYSIGVCGITVMITKKQGSIAASAAVTALLLAIVIFMMLIPNYGMGGAVWGLTAAFGCFGILMSVCVCFYPIK